MIIVNDSKDRELCPEGTHNAVCVTILDLGTQAHEKWGDKRKLNVAFEVDEEDEEGKRFIVFKTYTASLAQKASLTADLKSWLGIKIEKGEEFDMDTILNKPGMVTIVHNESTDGKVYANVDTITSLPKGIKPLKPNAEVVSMYLEEGSFDQEVFDNLPDFIQDKIKVTEEYKTLMASRVAKRKAKPEPVQQKQSRKAEPAKTAKGKRGR